MAKEESIVSLQKVLKETGATRSTVKRYRDIGFLPRPVRKEPFGNKGFISYYPASIIPKLKKVLRWRTEGLGIAEIRRRLAEDNNREIKH